MLLSCRKGGQQRASCCELPPALPHLQTATSPSAMSFPEQPALSQEGNACSRVPYQVGLALSGLNHSQTSPLAQCRRLPASYHSKHLTPQLCLSVYFQRTQSATRLFHLHSLLLHLPQISEKCLCIRIFWNYLDT